MSLQLSEIEIEQFLSEAHSEFQSEGFLLENAIRTKTGTKGSIVHFQFLAKAWLIKKHRKMM